MNDSHTKWSTTRGPASTAAVAGCWWLNRATTRVLAGTLIVMVSRVALMIGGVAVLVAVGVAIVVRGWEFASWVSAVIGAVALAGGWLTRGTGRKGTGRTVGDSIKQSKIRSGRDVVGKRGSTPGGQDEITQHEITAEQDVIGKDTRAASEQEHDRFSVDDG